MYDPGEWDASGLRASSSLKAFLLEKEKGPYWWEAGDYWDVGGVRGSLRRGGCCQAVRDRTALEQSRTPALCDLSWCGSPPLLGSSPGLRRSQLGSLESGKVSRAGGIQSHVPGMLWVSAIPGFVEALESKGSRNPQPKTSHLLPSHPAPTQPACFILVPSPLFVD